MAGGYLREDMVRNVGGTTGATTLVPCGSLCREGREFFDFQMDREWRSTG
jgi:hypothetical protein